MGSNFHDLNADYGSSEAFSVKAAKFEGRAVYGLLFLMCVYLEN